MQQTIGQFKFFASLVSYRTFKDTYMTLILYFRRAKERLIYSIVGYWCNRKKQESLNRKVVFLIVHVTLSLLKGVGYIAL